jgi:primosomal protein N''
MAFLNAVSNFLQEIKANFTQRSLALAREGSKLNAKQITDSRLSTITAIYRVRAVSWIRSSKPTPFGAETLFAAS